MRLLLAKHGEQVNHVLQANLCQKLLFLHQLNHNMKTDCSLNYKFNTWKFQGQNVGRTCCVQKLFLTFRTFSVHNMFSPCSPKRRASDKDLPVWKMDLHSKMTIYERYTLGFLAKFFFTPLLYHPGGCLECPEKQTRSRNYNLFVRYAVFSQNEMTFKKPTKIIKIQWKVTVFLDIFRVCLILAGKQQPKPIRWT